MTDRQKSFSCACTTPVDPRWRRPSPVNLEAIASSSTPPARHRANR